LLKKIGAVTLIDVLTKAVGFLLLPVYLGFMPKEEFGEFTFFFSAIMPCTLILSLALHGPFIRSFCDSDDNSSKNEIVSTIFLSLFIWIVCIDFLLILAKPFLITTYIDFFDISSFPDEKFYLILLLINSGTLLLYCYSLLMSRKSTSEIVIFIFAKFLLVTIISILLLSIMPFGYDSVLNRLIGSVVAELLVTIIYIYLVVRPYINFAINFELLKNHLKLSLPLLPSGLIGLFMVMIDRGLITEYHGLDALASYNLAMMALIPIPMIMSGLQVAWAPHLFSLKNQNDALKQSIKLIKISFGLMFLSATIISAIFYLAIMYEWISIEYYSVPKVIIFASLGVVASSIIHLTNNLFLYLKKTKYQLLIVLIILIINWIMNILLVPSYSYYGAGIAAGSAFSIGLLISLFILFKIIKN
jgi:O-antigen/teichoic acid export membrane protein